MHPTFQKFNWNIIKNVYIKVNYSYQSKAFTEQNQIGLISSQWPNLNSHLELASAIILLT